MSDAKREHSEFNHSAVAGRALARIKAAGPEPMSILDSTGLRVLEPWESKAVPGGDPYNGIGARAAVGRGLRK